MTAPVTDLTTLIDKTAAAAGADWCERADSVIRELASTRETFTADDVWLAGLEKPREGRALGGVMQSARRAGLIESTGRYQPSVIPSYHAKPQVVWRSKVFRPVSLVAAA